METNKIIPFVEAKASAMRTVEAAAAAAAAAATTPTKKHPQKPLIDLRLI